MNSSFSTFFAAFRWASDNGFNSFVTISEDGDTQKYTNESGSVELSLVQPGSTGPIYASIQQL